MKQHDGRASQAQLAYELDPKTEHEGAVAYADAHVANLTGRVRDREYALAYQFAREFFAGCALHSSPSHGGMQKA